jgi:hypothetical protein
VKNIMKDRQAEILLGFLITAIGGLLLWDAFDNRGKKLPWPLSGLAFW